MKVFASMILIFIFVGAATCMWWVLEFLGWLIGEIKSHKRKRGVE